MKAPFLTLTLMLAVMSSSHAQEVIHLPEDGGLWHTTLVLPSDSPIDSVSKRLVEHFAHSPRLQKLTSQTMLHRYTPSDPLFAARYEPYFGGVFPALLVQKADGTVIYKVSGEAIPESGEKLADEIAQAIDQCCPLRPKPQPTPQPSPSPSPQPSITPFLPDVNINVVPDIRPTKPEEPEPAEEAPKPSAPKSPLPSPMSPLLLIAPLIAAGLGLRRSTSRVF